MPPPLARLLVTLLLLVAPRVQDRLFHHARVWSGDVADAATDAVLVVGRRVRFVGDAKTARDSRWSVGA